MSEHRLDAPDAAPLARMRGVALTLGIAGIAATVALAFFDLDRALQSYLFAYLSVFDLPIGCLAMLMAYHLTGGAWGTATRRVLEAATRTMLACGLFFVPIVAGITRIYPWGDALKRAADPKLAHKAAYLNPGAFTVRALVFFAGWTWLARALDRASPGAERNGDVEKRARLRTLSGGGMVFLGFTVTFASIDWQMSLEPHWFSTIYGMLFGAGGALGAWAFVLIVLALLLRGGAFEDAVRSPRPAPVLGRKVRYDLGSLLCMLLMVWAYLSFFQFLIIWSGNIPDEVTWYIHRSEHGWGFVALLLALIQFAGPFAAMLFRGVKARRRAMIGVCAIVLLARLVDHYWQVMPALHPDRIPLGWPDLTALVGLGGLWLSHFLAQLGRRPAFAERDPDWDLAVEVPAHA